jgi:Na+/glutamate symporter
MLGAHNSEMSSFTVFLSGVVFGIIMGLFFASYLLEKGKFGAKNGGKNKNLSHTLPPSKEFSKIINK